MRLARFSSPASDRWYEDYEPGATYVLGTFSLSEAEIIDFATRFDPQSFHIDAKAAAESHFGGIIASGWHTAAAAMRLLVDGFISTCGGLGSPGLDQIRWVKPVRPGMVLEARVTVREKRVSQSKPDRGLISHTVEVLDAKGELMMSYQGTGMVRLRP